MISTIGDRVSQNTCDSVNEQIQRQTEQNVGRYAHAGRESISGRLEELDAEWDIERYIETLAPSITLTGICLGLGVSRKWLALPFFVQSFLLQHAIQGWCPPIPILRRLGIRTTQEIDRERNALKALRGDYREMSHYHERDPEKAMDAAQR